MPPKTAEKVSPEIFAAKMEKAFAELDASGWKPQMKESYGFGIKEFERELLPKLRANARRRAESLALSRIPRSLRVRLASDK